MIKKVLTIIIFVLLVFSLSQTIVLTSYLFNKELDSSNISKDLIINILPYLYIYGFDSKIFYDGNYKASNKVDIVISNHINQLDFIINTSLIRLFDNRPIYLLFDKKVVFIPAIGLILNSGKDIKLNRKLEDDLDNINTTINNIKEGIIFIMPEGVIFTQNKLSYSQKYSKDNNLKVFNNILFPKMKGLFLVFNILKKNNKLGNLIDITIELKKLKNIDIFFETNIKNLLTKSFGNSYSIINTYKIPENVLVDYDFFKKWFIKKIWIKKENILNNMHDTKYNYKELKPNIKLINLFIIIFLFIIFFNLIIHTNGFYIPISLLISYIIVFIKMKNTD